jgi:capsular polysaccharide transport system permease protein
MSFELRHGDVAPSFRNFFAGLGVQLRVWHALLIRELMMRYGRNNIGFLWLVLEPMILCAGVVAVRWIIQGHEEHGVPLVAMLLSGYMPLTLWRHLTGKSVFMIRRNMGIMYHRTITALDIFIVTMALEFIGCTFAYAVNYFAFILIGVLDPIRDYGYVIAGWLLMGLLAVGVASMFALLVERYEASERFIAPAQYLILPISGMFYMADWLPESVRDWALYIPLLHCFEITRHGFFGEIVPTHYTAAYPALIGVALLAIFLPQFEKARDLVAT